MAPPAWLTTWLQNLLKPLIQDAVDRAVVDLKAEIQAGSQNVINEIVGTETGVVQQILNGIKAILPFPL